MRAGAEGNPRRAVLFVFLLELFVGLGTLTIVRLVGQHIVSGGEKASAPARLADRVGLNRQCSYVLGRGPRSGRTPARNQRAPGSKTPKDFFFARTSATP